MPDPSSPSPGDTASPPPEPLIEVVDEGGIRWRFEPAFLRSNWTCIWDRGCCGIGDTAEPEAQLGCCSVGAEMVNPDEARAIAALAAMVDPEHMQYWNEARDGGVFSDESATNTRVVDGACIFLNRPSFDGPQGCALHRSALAFDEPAWQWKPEVCWELPIKVDWNAGGDEAVVRRWSRKDWGPDGETMAWCCTEEPESYVGDQSVIDSLGGELREIVGREVYVELKRRIGPADSVE